MKFFFDNNLSKHLAHGIRELSAITTDGEKVIHLTDRFARDAPDLTWIGDLSKDGPWYILSIDRFKKQHGAEREAIRRAGHTVFILDAQWSKQRFWQQSERLVRLKFHRPTGKFPLIFQYLVLNFRFLRLPTS